MPLARAAAAGQLSGRSCGGGPKSESKSEAATLAQLRPAGRNDSESTAAGENLPGDGGRREVLGA